MSACDHRRIEPDVADRPSTPAELDPSVRLRVEQGDPRQDLVAGAVAVRSFRPANVRKVGVDRHRFAPPTDGRRLDDDLLLPRRMGFPTIHHRPSTVVGVARRMTRMIATGDTSNSEQPSDLDDLHTGAAHAPLSGPCARGERLPVVAARAGNDALPVLVGQLGSEAQPPGWTRYRAHISATVSPPNDRLSASQRSRSRSVISSGRAACSWCWMRARSSAACVASSVVRAANPGCSVDVLMRPSSDRSSAPGHIAGGAGHAARAVDPRCAGRR